MSELNFMQEAIKEAKRALEFDEIPVGAVVVRNGEILGRGCNRRDADNSPFAHAEMIAIKDASDKLNNWRLDDCTLYVTLEPCPMCAGAVVQCRIKKLVYGAKDAKAGAAGTLYNIPKDPRFAHKCTVIGGVMETECRKLLSDFFKGKRKTGQKNN